MDKKLNNIEKFILYLILMTSHLELLIYVKMEVELRGILQKMLILYQKQISKELI